MNSPFHLVFVCISNRVRSVFSEFLFPKMLSEVDKRLLGQVKVSSAGFMPVKVRERMEKMDVAFPEPFYQRPMAEITRATLLQRGFAVPQEWRSKELTPEMIEEADLIITALPEQKEELSQLYPKARSKIFSIREMSNWEGYLFFEDFTILPKGHTFWDYVEGDPEYVSKVIAFTEETLVRAFPNILRELGISGYKKF